VLGWKARIIVGFLTAIRREGRPPHGGLPGNRDKESSRLSAKKDGRRERKQSGNSKRLALNALSIVATVEYGPKRI